LLFELFCGHPLFAVEADTQWVRFFLRVTGGTAASGDVPPSVVDAAASQALGHIHHSLPGFMGLLLQRHPRDRPTMPTAAAQWGVLWTKTLSVELPAYIPPKYTQAGGGVEGAPLPSALLERGHSLDDAEDTLAEQLALYRLPVEVAPGIWVGATPDPHFRTLSCEWRRSGEAPRPSAVQLIVQPGEDAGASVESALQAIQEAGRPLWLTGDAEAIGVVTTAWLLQTHSDGTLDLMAAISRVAARAPGLAPGAVARGVLEAWQRL
jgi:hypothetical protein